MREIRFRAWDSSRKRMIDCVDQIIFTERCSASADQIGESVNLKFQPHITVMQYTGLKDKNDKEIYEGDVIKVYDMNRGCAECDLIDSIELEEHTEECENYICTQKVKWNSYTGYVCAEDTGEFCPLLGSDELELEVIGNIYENPEVSTNNKQP